MSNELEDKMKPQLPGEYILYSFHPVVFEEKIKPYLDDDDHFLHNPDIHPQPSYLRTENVSLWLHFDHYRESGSARLLRDNLTYTRNIEKFFAGFNNFTAINTGYSLMRDKQGNLDIPGYLQR